MIIMMMMILVMIMLLHISMRSVLTWSWFWLIRLGMKRRGRNNIRVTHTSSLTGSGSSLTSANVSENVLAPPVRPVTRDCSAWARADTVSNMRVSRGSEKHVSCIMVLE